MSVNILKVHPDGTVTAEIHISMGRNGKDYRRRHTGEAEGMYAVEREIKATLGKKECQVVTFGRLCDEFETWSKPQKSFEKHKKYLISAVRNKFAHLSVSDFPALTLDQYKTKLQTENKSVATVNRYLALIHTMFTKAVEWGFCDEETCKRIHNVKLLKGEKKRVRFLTEQEAKRLVLRCPAHLKPIVMLALHTGMRKSEILSLTWGQVNFDTGFIHLPETKNLESRNVPINATASKVLKAIPQNTVSDRVFFYQGEAIQDVRKSFTTACTAAGLTDFHFHDLRHTFASWLVMKGIPILTVMKLLGHKSLKMTQRYAHLAPDHISQAVYVLDGVGKRGQLSKKQTSKKKKGITQN